MALTIIVNGEAIEVAQNATVDDLYKQLDLDAKWVVAERNGEPVSRSETATTTLTDGDRIELVKAVSGG